MMKQEPQRNDYGFEIAEEEEIILESLIKSPAFATLKKVLDRYRKDCHSVLLSANDMQKIFQTQGRIIGIGVVENLPTLLVSRRQERIKREAEKKKFEPKISTPKNP